MISIPHHFVVIICRLFLILLVFVGCARYVTYVPDPVKDIGQWVRNFRHQRSFSYRYEMKTPFVKVHATGDCVIGVGERLKGQWEREDDVQEFEYIGLGDVEYTRRGGDWAKEPRGEESDVFAQIDRMLSFDKYEYQSFDAGYNYRFRANVPFLAPDRRKEMIGFLKIMADKFLPAYMWAGLPDSSTYWAAEIYGYNTHKNVKAPVQEYREYAVSYVAVSNGDLHDDLEKRLDLIGVSYRMATVPVGILIGLPEQYSIDDLEKMLRPGGLSVYGVAESGKAAQRTAYLKDDIYKPIFVSDLLFTDAFVRDTDMGFDQVSTPYITLRLRQKRNMPRVIAFEIDSIMVATATLDTLGKMDRIKLYPDMQYREIEILRAYIEQPLGAVKITSAGGENP